ncbi:SDR family NAD(P)-dependent oxidoreductase [Ammoniphilus sp. CFH 90114]|uniref:SDR family NAD(P)-dependent oxidoreductase n=1 Tax=Ammoniphilus sp. CFH 90114 TaxID=2493665 RepID=UPI00100FF9D5|nr:SDR family NAD(P)-dependent oxidoreductase [Ammoniphilus sp. CFH 90114]RXT06958.1 SDR family oxidoreductase [Ammoniphilus sp. CFH 90114]
MSSLTNQIAVVTGAGSGIGKAIAKELSTLGAHVYVTDINEENALHVASEIKGEGYMATAYKLDVSNSTDVSDFFQKVNQLHERVDILVNNAGIAGTPSLISNMTDEEWKKMLAIHVNGSFFCLREASKMMRKNRYGRVINMSSLASETSLAGFAHYGAAKYAIVGLTEAAAKELAAYNVTVNAIKPGVIRSALTQGILSMAEERLSLATPNQKIGEPRDIAQVVAMLAKPESSFVTGASIVVDGGFCLMNEMDRVVLEMLEN